MSDSTDLMERQNQNISSLGFELDYTEDVGRVEKLLEACQLAKIEDPASDFWDSSAYLAAKTNAGGLAATIGWSRSPDHILIHSLAVAPPSRGSGLGASMVATCMGRLVDKDPIQQVYLTTDSASAFFSRFGFERVEQDDELPVEVSRHPAFQGASEESAPMVRDYTESRRGLDHCAFRLLHNTTENATLPSGSVFRFQQSSNVVEADYRGGSVQRGQLIGSIEGDELDFLWQHCLVDGGLAHGNGRIYVKDLGDGRRELRERVGQGDPGELHLREL